MSNIPIQLTRCLGHTAVVISRKIQLRTTCCTAPWGHFVVVAPWAQRTRIDRSSIASKFPESDRGEIRAMPSLARWAEVCTINRRRTRISHIVNVVISAASGRTWTSADRLYCIYET